MDQAHIRTTITVSDTIQVKDTIPVVFDLPLSQKTEVTLTKNTPIKGATIYLNGQAVPLDLDLPPGTKLGIQLDLTVPVNQTVPVVLNVPVNLQRAGRYCSQPDRAARALRGFAAGALTLPQAAGRRARHLGRSVQGSHEAGLFCYEILNSGKLVVCKRFPLANDQFRQLSPLLMGEG